MTKEKLLTYLVIVLVLLNAVLIIFVLTDRQSKPPRRPQVFEVITERLNLDRDQQTKFNKLRHDHRRKMDSLDNSFEQAMLNYFDLLRDSSVNKQAQDSIETIMGNIEKQKAKTTLLHFFQVKSILRQDQKSKFDDLTPELIKVMGSRNSKPPKRD